MHDHRSLTNCGTVSEDEAMMRLTSADIDNLANTLADKVVERLIRRPTCKAKEVAKNEIECGDSLAVSYKEAARLVGVHERTVWSLCKEGKLKTIAIGRAKRVLRNSIANFIATQST